MNLTLRRFKTFFVPSHPSPCLLSIVLAEVAEAIAQSKPARARGPDNWSNEDSKNLPPILVSQLCEVLVLQ